MDAAPSLVANRYYADGPKPWTEATARQACDAVNGALVSAAEGGGRARVVVVVGGLRGHHARAISGGSSARRGRRLGGNARRCDSTATSAEHRGRGRIPGYGVWPVVIWPYPIVVQGESGAPIPPTRASRDVGGRTPGAKTLSALR